VSFGASNARSTSQRTRNDRVIGEFFKAANYEPMWDDSIEEINDALHDRSADLAQSRSTTELTRPARSRGLSKGGGGRNVRSHSRGIRRHSEAIRTEFLTFWGALTTYLAVNSNRMRFNRV
jgi:hypothetical protein